ncbi:hypothetical protein FRC17_002884 [Serendipita sp. 399]|nr:hypothetical protein FRC17_002884 [Serendipita sp. 399]
MIAYPENGVPIASSLGSGTGSMQWTPPFAAGTKLILSVVDSLGNSGGVSRRSYIVGSGPAGCVPSNSNSDLKITISSAGNTLQTCDTLPIRIEGGTKPYTVTLASTDSDSAVNITLNANNDYLQWINKATPNQELIASVSDSTGRYATSSQLFTTAGTTDKSCPGLQDSQSIFGGAVSSSSQRGATSSGSYSSPTSVPDNGGGSRGKNFTGAIIGTIVALLAVFGIIAYFFFRRRNQRHFGEGSGGGGGGFGLMEYKKGGNLPGNDSFIPLKDHDASPSAPKMPLYGGDYSPSTATNPSGFGGTGSRQSGLDYYSSPPSSFSGNTSLAPPQSHLAPVGLGVGIPAAGPGLAQQSKHQMMLEDRQRQQQLQQRQQQGWGQAPPSVYPPMSSYTVNPVNPAHKSNPSNPLNPFGDNAYPYNPPAGGVPPSVVSSTTYGHNPARSLGSELAYAAPTPSQQNPASNPVTSSASGSQGAPTLSAAGRAKAAEAAQERGLAYDDDDDDPIPYLQQNRPVLGVTNPDRQSVATTNTTASEAYGGVASAPAQVIQHEDAGGVIELPPAYREFSRTPGPGA